MELRQALMSVDEYKSVAAGLEQERAAIKQVIEVQKRELEVKDRRRSHYYIHYDYLAPIRLPIYALFLYFVKYTTNDTFSNTCDIYTTTYTQ